MPCMDGGPSREQIREQRAVPMMLCALATVAEKSGILERLLGEIDWNEAGVLRSEFVAWWERHKKEDAARRAEDTARLLRDQCRHRALAKLTPEERRALGLAP